MDGPNLVRPAGFHALQEIRENALLDVAPAQIGAGTDALDTEFPHEPLDPLAVDGVTFAAHHGGDPPRTVIGMRQVERQDPPLDLRLFLRGGGYWPVVDGGSADVQEPGLLGHGQFAMTPVKHLSALFA